MLTRSRLANDPITDQRLYEAQRDLSPLNRELLQASQARPGQIVILLSLDPTVSGDWEEDQP